MADVNARIGIDVDASQALAQIKQLQRQISLFHTNMTKGGAAAAAEAQNLQRNLVNSINATGQFSASMTRISTTAESFTNALEKNKLSLGQYFRYAGASTKTFGSLFKSEFSTIEKVARERVKSLQTQYIKMGRDANGAMQAIKVRPLTLDLQNLGTQTAIAAQKQQLFNQLIKQGSTNLLNWGKNTQWAGRQLMVGFTIPLTIFGATAAREFMKLEEQAIRFKRVYGDMFTAEAEVEKAIADIKELASEFTKYGIAVEKTVDLAASVAQMGATGEDLKNQVTEATRLAVLGGIEQQEALNTTISLTNAFGLATEELTGKIAFLNAAENQTILSIEDFNEAIPKAGSVVKQLGGDVEDLAYFLTAMREGGVNASQAANALKSSLARLVNPTEVAREKMNEFGIDIVGIVESNAGNLRATIQVLAQELDKLDPLNKSRAIEQLFGKFQFARMSTLFENIVKEGSQANQILELTTYNSRELAVIAERELARVEGSPMFKFRKTLEDFQAALAPVGEAFLKLATPLIEFGTKVLEKFNQMGDGAKMFVVGLTGAIGVVAPAALMLIGLLANGIANLMLFGSKISQAFSRASGSSNVLTEQLNYMNSEQLESAAVAASLDQVHQTLIQTFNAEAGAIGNLTGAYGRAIAAQRQFLASQGAAGAAGAAASSRGGKPPVSTNPFMPPKYADGILSVPGPKGAGDIVAAMLSPGEAVIPADMAEKYAPFINSIISDNVPGFEDGTDRLPVSRPFVGKSNLMHQQSGETLPLDLAAKISGPAGEAARGLKLLGETTTNAAVKVEMAEREFNVKSLWGMMGDEGLNQQSQQGAVLDDLRADMGSRTSEEIWSEGVQGGGVKPEEALDDMEEYNEEYRRQIDMANNGQAKYFTDTEENLEKARKRLGNQFKPEEWTSQERIDNATAEAVAARNPKNKVVKARGVAKTSYREARDYTLSRAAWEEGMASDDPRISEPIRKKYTRSSGDRPRSANFGLNKQAKKDVANLVKSGQTSAEAFNDGVESTVKDPFDVAGELAGRNSPHPEAFPNGAEDAQDYLRGQQSVMGSDSDPYGASSRSSLTPPPPPPATPAPKRGFMRGMAERAANSKIGTGFAAILARGAGNELVDKDGKVIVEAAKEQKKAARETSKAAKELNQGAQELEQGAQVLENAARQEAASEGGGTYIAGGGGDGKKDKTKPAKKRMGSAGGAMGLSMGLSALTMGASMAPGALGEQAQKLMPALMGLSMAPMLFQALQSPLMAVLAIVAAVAGGIIMLNNKFKEAQKEAYEMGKALGASKDAMRDLAEFAGTVSSGEYMDKVREERLTGVNTAPGKTTFGESFVENEAGQNLIKAAEMSIAATGNAQAAIGQITSQLSTAIISGVIDKEQASSIASNLALALGDMEIGLEVRANIAELVGPNGEDITGGDIIELSARMNQTNLDQINSQVEMLNRNIEDRAFGTQTQRNIGIGGMVAAGAGAGAGIGAGIGALVGGIPTAGLGAAPGAAIGAVIGTGIGAISGAIGGFFLMKEQAEEAGKLSGAAVATITNALEQQQELSDALDAYYLKKIEEAKVQGDITEQLRLQAEYEQKKVEMSEQEMAMRDQMRGALEGPGAEAARAGIGAAIETRFKDDPAAQMLLPAIEATMNSLDMSSADQDVLNLELATGAISPAALNNLLTFIGEDQQQRTALLDIVGQFGGVFADEASQVMSLIDDEELAADIFVNISQAGNEQEAEDILGFVREIQRQDAVFDTDIILNYMTNNAAAKKELEEIFDRADMGVTEIDQAYEINPKLNDPEAFDEAYFDMLSDGDKEQYVKTVSMILAMDEAELQASDDFLKWTGDEGLKYGSYPGGNSMAWWQKRYAEDMGVKVTQALSTVDTTTGDGEEEETGGGGGGGPKGSMLDGLLEKLKQVRDATIEVTKGWAASRAKLDELFGEGRNIKIFGGIEQQMRSLGLGQNLIEAIVGMDPEEYEKRKDELFQFDEAGNIIGVTTALGNMGRALNAIALGEFQNEQERVLSGLNDQMVAMRKLTAAGMSTANAYEAVKDAAFAAAIAREKDNDVIRETIKLTEEATEATRAYQAAQALAKQNAETGDLRDVVGFINKNTRSLSEAQKEAILSDKNLQTLIMNPEVDPKTLREALKNAENQADLDLKIKKLTFEGLIEVFEDGFGKAMEAFSVKEKEIELDFDVKKDPFLDAIKDAEEDIADIRNRAGGLDDLQADLERISFQEDDINETYDARKKALDQVLAANKAIQQQQKSQLDVAEALSRGDIAAAAQAAQQYRQQQADAASRKQSEQLELAREQELARLVGQTGKTRKELEEEIKQLNQEIFNIEELRLEPAQRQVELLDRSKAELIEGLEVLGKTREEWERTKNNVDLAKISSDKFVKAMQDALDVVKDITSYWDNMDGQVVDLFVNVKQMGVEPEELIESLAPPPAPDGGGGGGSTAEEETEEAEETPDYTGGRESGSILGSLRPPVGQPYSVKEAEQLDEAIIEQDRLRDMVAEQQAKIDDTLWMTWKDGKLAIGKGAEYAPKGQLAALADLQAELDTAEDLVETRRASLDEKMARAQEGDPNAAYNQGVQTLSEAVDILVTELDQNAEGVIGNNIPGYLRDLGVKVPTLLQNMPNFFANMDPIARDSIQNKITGYLQHLGTRAPELLRNVPDFINSLPEQTQDAILNRIPNSFWEANNIAVGNLEGISEWFNLLPEDVRTAIEGDVTGAFNNLANMATEDLDGTLGEWFHLLPPSIVDLVEGEMHESFVNMAKESNQDLDTFIKGWFDSLPAETKGAIETELAGSFGNLSTNAISNLDPVVQFLLGVPDQIAGSFTNSEGQITGTADAMERAFSGSSSSIAQQVEDDLTGGTEAGADGAEEGFDSMSDYVDQLPIAESFEDHGRNSGQGFKNEFTNQLRNYRPTFRVIREVETRYINGGGGIPGPPSMGSGSISTPLGGFNVGGSIPGYEMGSLPMNRKVPGTANYDKIPTMLTPGEFVMRQDAVKKYGQAFMYAINSAKLPPEAFSVPEFTTPSKSYSTSNFETSKSGVLYNNSYQINVNVKSEANPDQIARTVRDSIKRVDSQRIRSNRL